MSKVRKKKIKIELDVPYPYISKRDVSKPLNNIDINACLDLLNSRCRGVMGCNGFENCTDKEKCRFYVARLKLNRIVE